MDIQALMKVFKEGSGTSTEHAVMLVYGEGFRDGIASVERKVAPKPTVPPAAPLR
jgi:hypothetical protein